MSGLRKRIALVVVCLVSLFAGPNLFAVIWGPAPVPPLGTYRDVMFFSCGENGPSNTGNEWWDCLRHLHQTGSAASYAYVEDFDCTTEESESLTFWCKDGNGNWHELTETQFMNCETCPTN
ncbi:MAG TPA: hypothetical protein VHW00_13700 [Thermoanaerobaculia bacterium]|nr:hypothetical protein [Thermoanaerobaculia bacterium]